MISVYRSLERPYTVCQTLSGPRYFEVYLKIGRRIKFFEIWDYLISIRRAVKFWFRNRWSCLKRLRSIFGLFRLLGSLSPNQVLTLRARLQSSFSAQAPLVAAREGLCLWLEKGSLPIQKQNLWFLGGVYNVSWM